MNTRGKNLPTIDVRVSLFYLNFTQGLLQRAYLEGTSSARSYFERAWNTPLTTNTPRLHALRLFSGIQFLKLTAAEGKDATPMEITAELKQLIENLTLFSHLLNAEEHAILIIACHFFPKMPLLAESHSEVLRSNHCLKQIPTYLRGELEQAAPTTFQYLQKAECTDTTLPLSFSGKNKTQEAASNESKSAPSVKNPYWKDYLQKKGGDVELSLFKEHVTDNLLHCEKAY